MEVPLVTLADVALASKLDWKRSLRFIRQFHQYRQNLKRTSWSCLTSFYPRANYMTYYYLLFWWADYCNVHTELLAKPDRSLIAELFFRYIVEIDRLIDTPEGSTLLKMPSLIKANPTVDNLLKEIFNHVEDLNLPTSAKRKLFQEMWKYRHECLIVCRRAANRSSVDLEAVLRVKQKTSGGLFRVWVSLLSSLYCDGLPQKLVENSQKILSEASMAMQVFEDMLDFPEDYAAETLNIFHEILKRNPSELVAAKAHLKQIWWQHLDFTWAQQHLPVSYQAAIDLSNHYLQNASYASLNPGMTADLCKLIGNLPNHPVGV